MVGFVPTRVRKPLDPSCDEILFCSPLAPLPAVSCCYVLLPSSGMEGAVQDLEVLVSLLSITPYPKRGGALLTHRPRGTFRAPALPAQQLLGTAGPGEQKVLSPLLPLSLHKWGCAHWAGREEMLQRGRHWAALTATAGAVLEHSSVQFGITSPHTLKICHGSIMPLILTPRNVGG